jgi:ribosome-associated toxin RatA of RatAB toxin-antitoxin module
MGIGAMGGRGLARVKHGSSRYTFRSTWLLDADPDRVFQTLADVETYPDWWPQVRGGHRIDDMSGQIVCRSLLPYDLTFVATRVVEDPTTRVLRATLHGDLNGTSQWSICPDGSGTVAVFDEDVTVGNSLIRAAGLAARPVLRYNHDLMMRAGERGLQRHFAAKSDPVA